MKNAVRNPDWWIVVLTFIEVVGLGFLAYFLAWEKENREVDTLFARLESNAIGEYEPVAYELLQHRRGIERIEQYAENQHCAPWDKALFVGSLIRRFDTTEKPRAVGLRMIWSSWNCNAPDLGMDIQLYELLKVEPRIACPIALGDLRDGQTIFRQAALIVILNSVCPQHQSPVLKGWQEDIHRCVGGRTQNSRQGPESPIVDIVVCTNVFVSQPWPESYSMSRPPRLASRESWRLVVFGLYSLFQPCSSCGDAPFMWGAMVTEPLWSRIVLAHVVALPSQGSPASDKKDVKRQLREWIKLALASTDSDSKIVALKAILNLQLGEHRQDVQSLALRDPDPFVRREADEVLAYVKVPR